MLIDFRQLFPKYGIKPNGVLHVGANVGEEAPVYDELGIKKVIWFEANPRLFDKLKDNTQYKYRHGAFNLAVGDETKRVTLHVSNNAGQSSSILDLGTHKQAHPEVHYVEDIEVQMVRLDEFFNDWCAKGNDFFEHLIDGVDFLNVDIQGFELNALKGMGEYLHQFKWAYLEVNKEELYKGCALVGEIDEYLAGFGFTRIETKWVGNTGWGDALYIKNIRGELSALRKRSMEINIQNPGARQEFNNITKGIQVLTECIKND